VRGAAGSGRPARSLARQISWRPSCLHRSMGPGFRLTLWAGARYFGAIEKLVFAGVFVGGGGRGAGRSFNALLFPAKGGGGFLPPSWKIRFFTISYEKKGSPVGWWLSVLGTPPQFVTNPQSVFGDCGGAPKAAANSLRPGKQISGLRAWDLAIKTRPPTGGPRGGGGGKSGPNVFGGAKKPPVGRLGIPAVGGWALPTGLCGSHFRGAKPARPRRGNKGGLNAQHGGGGNYHGGGTSGYPGSPGPPKTRGAMFAGPIFPPFHSENSICGVSGGKDPLSINFGETKTSRAQKGVSGGRAFMVGREKRWVGGKSKPSRVTKRPLPPPGGNWADWPKRGGRGAPSKFHWGGRGPVSRTRKQKGGGGPKLARASILHQKLRNLFFSGVAEKIPLGFAKGGGGPASGPNGGKKNPWPAVAATGAGSINSKRGGHWLFFGQLIWGQGPGGPREIRGQQHKNSPVFPRLETGGGGNRPVKNKPGGGPGQPRQSGGGNDWLKQDSSRHFSSGRNQRTKKHKRGGGGAFWRKIFPSRAPGRVIRGGALHGGCPAFFWADCIPQQDPLVGGGARGRGKFRPAGFPFLRRGGGGAGWGGAGWPKKLAGRSTAPIKRHNYGPHVGGAEFSFWKGGVDYSGDKPWGNMGRANRSPADWGWGGGGSFGGCFDFFFFLGAVWGSLGAGGELCLTKRLVQTYKG